jgi:hypothetical protein
LNVGAFVDPRPQIIFEPHGAEQVTATVTLPLAVPPPLRVWKSSRPYLTERTAKKDAAFEAYLSLYKAGLINDNLLPLKIDADNISPMEDKVSIRTGPPRFDPWPAVAEITNMLPITMQKFLVTVSDGKESFCMTLCSPEIPTPSIFNLHWNRSTIYQVVVKHEGLCKFNQEEVKAARRITKKVLSTAYETRMSKEHDDFLTYFLPVGDPESSFFKDDWTSTTASLTSLQNDHQTLQSFDTLNFGIVVHQNTKYLFKRFAPMDWEQLAKTSGKNYEPKIKNDLGVVVSGYPKRRDL